MEHRSRCPEFELIERINTDARRHQLRLFGMIDGTVDNASVEQFFQLAPESEYEPLFLETEYSACLPATPYLFCIDEADIAFLQNWGHRAENQVIWWLSPFTLDQQIGYWRSLIQAIDPGGESVVFRYWNAAILDTYLGACSAQERNQLLAPCHTMFTPATQRQWSVWDVEASPRLHTSAAPWWQIQPSHLTAFQPGFERVLADQIEDELWRTDALSMQRIYPPLIPEVILSGTRQAQLLGLESDEALTQFVRCQFRFGTQYWRHPALTPMWDLTATKDANFLQWASAQLA